VPALDGGLLWDGAAHITRPELCSVHGLWRTGSGLGATQQYYPLLRSAFWIEYKLWGGLGPGLPPCEPLAARRGGYSGDADRAPAGAAGGLAGALSVEPGRLQGATEDYRTALRLEPNNPDASYNLEMARSKAGAAKPR